MFNEKKTLIIEYIEENECKYICDKNKFNCENCNNFDDCHMEAEIRYNDDFNNRFARAVNFGGYNNEEDFWEQLLN